MDVCPACGTRLRDGKPMGYFRWWTPNMQGGFIGGGMLGAMAFGFWGGVAGMVVGYLAGVGIDRLDERQDRTDQGARDGD